MIPPSTRTRQPWQARARCARPDVDPETMFDQEQYRLARAACASCPVTRRCLAAALTAEQGTSAGQRHGVYGGLTPAQRAALARRTAPTS